MEVACPVPLPDEAILTLEALEEMEDRVARLQRMIDGARSLRKDDDKGAKNQDGFDWL